MNTAVKFRTATCAIFSILLIDFVIFAGAAHPDLRSLQAKQTQQRAIQILRAQDFTDPRLDRGSGLEPVEFAIEINSGLAPYLFRLTPNKNARWSEKPRFVGKIEISRIGEDLVLQTISVTVVADVTFFTKSFSAEDINFDGYLDFKVLSDHGAKWGSYQYWVFDPTSGKFTTTELTRQLGEIKANTRDWNSESRTLQVGFLNLDQARIGETYRIEDAGLTLIEIQDRVKDCEGNFREVTYKIIDGKRNETKRFCSNLANAFGRISLPGKTTIMK